MRIVVELFYRIKDLAPPRFHSGPVELEVEAPFFVRDLFPVINLAKESPRIILVDGRAASAEDAVAEGQTVTIFPPLDGG